MEFRGTCSFYGITKMHLIYIHLLLDCPTFVVFTLWKVLLSVQPFATRNLGEIGESERVQRRRERFCLFACLGHCQWEFYAYFRVWVPFITQINIKVLLNKHLFFLNINDAFAYLGIFLSLHIICNFFFLQSSVDVVILFIVWWRAIGDDRRKCYSTPH